MTLRRMIPVFAAGLASPVLTLITLVLPLTSTGCSSGNQPVPGAPFTGVEVVGTLVAKRDDRPVDGDIALTLETARGLREVVRVPGLSRIPPGDSVLAMHKVVDTAKLGDRLRARGTRDEAGALRVEMLELISRSPWGARR